MGKANVIQNSFAAGELSPRMLSRTDLKGYKEGCQDITNMVPSSHGPLLSRSGCYHIGQYGTQKGCRLIPFHVAPDEVYTLVITDQGITVLQESGLPAGVSMTTNGRFQQGSLGWTTNIGTAPGTKGVVSFTSGTCILDAAPDNPAGIWQSIVTEVGVEYDLAVSCLNRNNARIKIGTTAMGSEILQRDMGTALVTQVRFTATTTSTFVYVEQPLGRTGTCTVSSIGMLPVDVAQQTAVNLTNPWPYGSYRDIQYEMQPAGRVMYFSHPQVTPQRVIFTAPGSFTIEAVTFTGAPTDWGTNDWPAAITFYEGRLWLAGNYSNPSKVWASQSGVFTDFTVGAEADDGLAYTIAKAGYIRWIKGMKDLLLGTDNSEFTLSSEGGVITPSDIVIEPQSAYGSLAHSPQQVGNQALYVSPDGRKLRAMGYRFEESGWISTDLTFASEHITIPGIYQMTWAQNPENIIWAIDLSGNLISCTYDKANTIIGWAKHSFTDFEIVSVSAARFVGTDRVWIALWDPIQSKHSVCIMAGITSPDIYCDSSIRKDYPTPTTTVTGLEHLEGRTVKVLTNGSVHPDRVVTGGQITLQYAATAVIVGVGYTRQMTTMPIDFSDNEGITEVRHKHLGKVYVRVKSSVRPMINGVRPSTRFPSTPMDTRDPLQSEDIQALSLGWQQRETITVSEDLPLPLTIISVFAEIGTS